MYRQNPDYFIPIGTDPKLAKMIRHQRYINTREHYHTVPYYDNLLISETEPDIQQLALWNALARTKGICSFNEFLFWHLSFRFIICKSEWNFKTGNVKKNQALSSLPADYCL